jgi:hypothetical protein
LSHIKYKFAKSAFETFYRFQFTLDPALTPDFEAIIDPTLPKQERDPRRKSGHASPL